MIGILSAVPLIIQAQNYVLTGMVQYGGTAAQGEVIVTDTQKTRLIKATSFENGKFRIEGLTDSVLLLQLFVSGIEQADTSLLITHSDFNQVKDLGTIYIQAPAKLEEVTIVTRKPLFEKTAEGTRINIENTMLANSVNAAELLSKTPGISVTGNKVNVFGRGEAMIMLDGKEIPFETFKSLPPAEIKSIEIVTNPGARHDAKAKALVIVTLKKGYRQGLQVNLTEMVTMGFKKNEPTGKYLLNAANVNLNYRKNNLHLTTYYSNEAGTTWNNNVFGTSVNSSRGLYTTNGRYNEDAHNKHIHTYRAGLTYDIGKRSYLSAQYDGLFHVFALDVTQNSDYFSPNGDLTNIAMKNNAGTQLVNHSANVNYLLQFDSTGTENLFIGAQYNNFENKLNDHITETISRSDNKTVPVAWNRVNDGLNNIELYTLQTDIVKKINSLKLETGFKYSQTLNRGHIRFLSKAAEENNFTENPAMAKDNVYTEMVPAAYFLLKGNKNKWSWQLGTRSEYSRITAYAKQLDRNIIDSGYINFFPNARIKQNLSEKMGHSLGYSHRINRPVYQDLDPFLWYLDSLTSIQGNPRLIPELLHQFEYNIWFNQFVLRLSYTRSKNTIWAITHSGQQGANSIVYIKDNIEGCHLFNSSVSIPFESRYYITYNTVAVNFYRFTDSRPQYKVNHASPQLYFYTYHQLMIPKWFNLDLNGEFYAASSDGYTSKKAYYYVTAGLSRSFLSENLSVQFLFNDILRTARWAGTRTMGSFVNTYDQRTNSYFMRLSVTFKFGGLRNFGHNNKMINEKEFGRIKK